jgi:Terminase small subunit
LLVNVGIAAAIAAGKARQLEKAELTAVATLEEIRRVGFSDIGALYDEAGRMKPLRNIAPAVRAAIASVKSTKKNLTVGDGTQEEVVEVRLWDKLRALEIAAKHFALLTDRLDHGGDIVIRWQSDWRSNVAGGS